MIHVLVGLHRPCQEWMRNNPVQKPDLVVIVGNHYGLHNLYGHHGDVAIHWLHGWHDIKSDLRQEIYARARIVAAVGTYQEYYEE